MKRIAGALLAAALLTLAPLAVPATAASSPASLPADPACADPAARPFVPRSVRMLGELWPVVGRPAQPNGVPQTPPATVRGKRQLAWDRAGIRPGSKEGHSLFNAHAWPDGSALGNRLDRSLRKGARLIVRGDDGVSLCYRVVRRVETRPGKRLAALYFGSLSGPHRVAIITCSGTRLGPGRWTHRTVWLAAPIR